MQLNRLFVGATVGMLLVCPLAQAEAPSNKQLAQQAAGRALQGANGPSTLTVSGTTIAGENHWFRINYDAGEAPDISSGRDDHGGQLPDGQYSYEIRSVAPAADAPALGAGNGNQLGRTQKQQPVQGWGSFDVVGGAVVPN
jgi:hypothetical protein